MESDEWRDLLGKRIVLLLATFGWASAMAAVWSPVPPPMMLFGAAGT